MTDQLPPHNPAHERAVLGSILIDPLAIHRVSNILTGPGDFHDQRWQWIYKAMLDLNSGGAAINELTVFDVLERRKQAIKVSDVTGLVADTPTSLHAEDSARIVADYAARRRLIEAAAEMTRAAYDTKSADPIPFAHKRLMELDNGNGGGLVSVAAASSAFYDQVEAWAKEPLDFGQVRGLATHMNSLDHLLGGLDAGVLVMMAGRPSMGKSALALEIGRRVGMVGRKTVAIFELEMTRQSIMMRWASAISGVESRTVQRGVCPAKYEGQPAAAYYVNADEMGRYVDAMGQLSRHQNIFIDDTPALTASQIRARAIQKAHQHGGLDLVLVDHTTIMGDESRYSNTAKSEGAKSEAMKNLAKELECPVLLVQQLSRATEARQNKRPTLADLRDSGEHEQNADIALGLYRESYYKDGLIPGSKADLELEVIGLKSREGPTAKIKIRYERNLHRFTEFTKEGRR